MTLYRVWFGSAYILMCAKDTDAVYKKYRRRITPPTKVERVRRSSEYQADGRDVEAYKRRRKAVRS